MMGPFDCSVATVSVPRLDSRECQTAQVGRDGDRLALGRVVDFHTPTKTVVSARTQSLSDQEP